MSWTPPAGWQRLTTIDTHVAGEPLRIVTGGFPRLPGDTMIARRAAARARHDELRRALMWEPRGHADMYGCVLTPPATSDGDLGVLFLHNEGFSTMCGHGIIGLVTAGVETGLIEAAAIPAAAAPGASGAGLSRGADSERVVRIDTPAGRVTATAHLRGERVERVSFLNVPSFVLAADVPLEVPGIGALRCDLAFGGAFYAYVDAAAAGVVISPQHAPRLIEAGRAVTRNAAAAVSIEHPEGDPALNFLYGTIFVQRLDEGEVHSRNVCIFAEGEVDRSPTGTGVSGRLAIHHARGELAEGETIVVESLIGTRFTGRVAKTTRVGRHPAIVPEISGTAFITGRHEFFIDPEDPLRHGFLIGP